MSRLRTLIAASILPLGSLVAQNPAPNAGPPVDPMSTVLRNATTGRRNNIARAFDSIPESKFGYKPTPAQLTIGYIAAHVASDSYLFCSNYGDMKPNLSDKEKATPDSVKATTWPKDSLVARLKAAFAFCDEAQKQLTDAKLAEMITITAPNGTTRQVVRLQYPVGHVGDLADHYSQLANYMRALGITPPTALPRPGRGGNK